MSGGVGAALDQAMEDGTGMGEVVQAVLFEDLEPHETGDLDAPSPLSGALTKGRAKGGRPKGAKNRRTEAVTAWLLSQHRHPLSVMMEAYSMTPIQLAEALGLRRATVTVKTTTTTEVDGKIVSETVEREEVGDHFDNDLLLDLFKLQMRMAEAVAPYVAQRASGAAGGPDGPTLNVSFAQVNLPGSGVSVPARGVEAEIPVGGGMAVRLGQVGHGQSDG